MKKSKFTESQIIKALRENDQGRKTEAICREMGIGFKSSCCIYDLNSAFKKKVPFHLF